ncbi:DEAD/DEAH box helicase [Rhodocaloribacter sp.]
MQFIFPPIYAFHHKDRKNRIHQLAVPAFDSEGEAAEYNRNRVKGYELDLDFGRVLLITNGARLPAGFDYALRLKGFSLDDVTDDNCNLTKAEWLVHPALPLADTLTPQQRVERVTDSWRGTFSFKKEDRTRDIDGLRYPQIGATHAVLSHWTVTDSAATVVMPTGTGKTETMLSIMVAALCSRVMIIVPTNALRQQIYDKFVSLGILKPFGIVSRQAQYPVVGMLCHRPGSAEEVDNFFQACNAVVTTINVAGQCETAIQARMAAHCSHLFIDEAHHVAARTWSGLKSQFAESRIVQFTATPFRNDGKPIEGKVVYNYPLSKAQSEDYFRPINFEPVIEFNPRHYDIAIAEKAIEQLEADYDKGHIVMARVGTIPRAAEVFAIYEAYDQYCPVQIHTGIKSVTERNRIKDLILSKQARIVVCVDMLGEGFDLPELKIAAFHDVRQSLPITLQLAGRFTRSRPDLGNATFIANLADLSVQEELRTLYRQDSDWNQLLRQISTEAISEEYDLWQFLEGFTKFPDEVPLQNVRPAMSAVAYRTHCDDWSPDDFPDGVHGYGSLDGVYHDINHENHTLVIVTNKRVMLDWANTEEIHSWEWELIIVFWDREQSLLFIHSSSNKGVYRKLARAIAGEDVELINGEAVFRCFAGIDRLRLYNVGLREHLGKLISYISRSGSDVGRVLSEAQRRGTSKSNIFGAGYEDGHKTTAGCTIKGRFWSRRVANIRQLTEWCTDVGAKLSDDTIDPAEVLRGCLVADIVTERPDVHPIGIEWPDVVYREFERVWSFEIGDTTSPLSETDIRLVELSSDGPLLFEIQSDAATARYELRIFIDNDVPDFEFILVQGPEVHIRRGGTVSSISDFFADNQPVIWFVDGSQLEGNMFIANNKEYDPFPINRVDAWDWTGIDIRKEALGIVGHTDSVQHRVIERMLPRNLDIVFDDDYKGEAADVICVSLDEPNRTIGVEFYHCKYSSNENPGLRLGDLYEVCGQAQKSIHWLDNPTDLFTHMMSREPKKRQGQERSRYILGNRDILWRIREMSYQFRVELNICIVQPGISKAQLGTAQGTEHRELLAVTDNYLKETYQIPFKVIVGP